MMRSMTRGLGAAFLGLFAIACSAQDATTAKYVEGKDYQTARQVQAPTDVKRIEVAEFFMYSCPHCAHFDPSVATWIKTKAGDVDFVRYPVSFGREAGRMHARAYYAADALNVLDAMHPALFVAFHEQHNPMNTEAQVQAVFTQVTGVMPDVVLATLKSFAVDARVRKSDQVAHEFAINSVPTIVVGGKYITSPAKAGGFEEAMAVVNYLVDKVRQERAGG